MVRTVPKKTAHFWEWLDIVKVVSFKKPPSICITGRKPLGYKHKKVESRIDPIPSGSGQPNFNIFNTNCLKTLPPSSKNFKKNKDAFLSLGLTWSKHQKKLKCPWISKMPMNIRISSFFLQFPFGNEINKAMSTIPFPAHQPSKTYLFHISFMIRKRIFFFSWIVRESRWMYLRNESVAARSCWKATSNQVGGSPVQPSTTVENGQIM